MSRAERARARLSAVGFMASLVGHKARNRLALVRAGLELLTLGAEAALTAEHRAELLAQFDRFLGDYNLGLEMIRCDYGAPETGLLASWLAEAAAAYRPQQDDTPLEVSLDVGERRGGGDAVALDRRLLRLVVLNLLRNSHEAGAKRVVIRARFARRAVRVEVRDDGPGVDGTVRAQLFDSPVTTRPGGTGLGLLLCADALSAMGGRIRLLAGGAGAAFALTIPDQI
ncbi:MAG TPA: ATP-binding protein [Opitutaceae bacterium]|jgi:signal transduction histidine kinase